VGADLPTPDALASTSVNIAAASGKIALSNNSTLFAVADPTSSISMVDFVGFGTANASEGTTAPAASNTTSISRKDAGSLDTDNNSTDFVVLNPPAPRNSATAPYIPAVPGPPLVSSLAPTNNATAVAVDSNLVITFTKPVFAGTGNITITETVGSNVFASIPIVDPQVVINGNTVTINPASDFALGKSYYVEIAATALKDNVDQAFAGISGSSTWSFTTFAPDLTAPVATAFSPATGSTVNPPASLAITFNEPVQEPVASAFVTVRKSDGTALAQLDTSLFGGTTTIAGNVATIALPPELPWEYGVSYYVEVDSGAFEDLAGNNFAGISGNSTWTFSTANVPDLVNVPYTQTFSTYTSALSLPLGWSARGGPGYLAGYEGDWGTISQGGFRGNASVFGYHHTSQSQTTSIPLEKILTLRNMTGAEISNLSVSYKGRAAVLINPRLPAYTVEVAGIPASALAYSTVDPDNSQRNASVSGLAIPAGATFQIKWISNYPSGSGSARQIGISDVSVSAGASIFAPTVLATSVSQVSIGSSAATVQAQVSSNGGATLSARGFVYSQTAINAVPELGGTGVSVATDPATTEGAFSATLSGLAAATSYTVRAYATNAIGTSYSSAVTFTTLVTSPTLVTSYTQQFANYNGTNPVGWTAFSSGGINAYIGDWGTGVSAGFRGGNSTPGVLGYQHTGDTGTLTVTLRLINGTGAPINTLNVGYLGRSQRADQARSPKWEVSVAGSAPVVALEYLTGPADVAKFAEVSGLNIAAGAEFTITWTCDRGLNTTGSSKQIGLADVYVGLQPPGPTNTYSNWATTNAGGQGPSLDFDGDGVPNGVEYFMGTAGNAFTATPGIISGAVTWPRAADTTISSFKVEVSSDLSTWEDATVNYAANLNITASQVVFTMPTGPAKLFVRLNVVP
jgi:hypothetical protein